MMEDTKTVADENRDNDIELTLQSLYDVPVQVSVVLGKTSMTLSNILKLGKGAVIELDRTIGEPIDVYINNKIVAKGEIVVVDDKIGVTLTEVVSKTKILK